MHARQKMHVASCLAGLSFNAAGLGITHSMAHQLGAIFHIPHGRANAMLLPHIVEFNANINKHSRSQQEYLPAVKRYANISHILGMTILFSETVSCLGFRRTGCLARTAGKTSVPAISSW